MKFSEYIIEWHENRKPLIRASTFESEPEYTYRQIADQFGMEKEQIEELCSRERRKQRKIEKGYIPQPKGRPRKTPATQEQLLDCYNRSRHKKETRS